MVSLKSFSAISHQGPYLQVNEDAVEVDLNHHLSVLMDGIGGSQIGDRACRLGLETILTTYTKISGDPESTLPFFYSQKYLIEGNALINAFYKAHAVIREDNKEREMKLRGATSAIALARAKNIVTFVGSGNCTAYLYRRGSLKVVIFPDSLEAVSINDYQPHLHTMPMSALGLFEDVALSVREYRILEGDIIVLMSDGVYARITPQEIQAIFGDATKNNDKKIDALLSLSNERGNLDNQSCLILNY